MCNIKNRLEIAVSESGLSRSEICRLSGVSKTSLSEYLQGTSEPRTDSLIALAEVLEVSAAWLLGCDSLKDYVKLNDIGRAKVEEYIKDLLPRHKKRG